MARKRRNGKGRGWHGDPEGHSRASRGITSLRDFPTPTQALDRSVVSAISQIRRLKEARREAVRLGEAQSAELFGKQIEVQETFLKRVLKASQLELMEVEK